jgi:hypothetical protein
MRRPPSNVERGEQRSRAVLLGIVGHRLASIGIGREALPGAVEGLDLTLLIDAGDRKAYQALAQLTVERQERLTLRQEMVEAIVGEGGRVQGPRLRRDDRHVPSCADTYRVRTWWLPPRCGDRLA